MTAINVILHGGEVHIATDGAFYANDRQTIVGFGSKVTLASHLPAALAMSGPGGWPIREHLIRHATTFDGLLEGLADRFRTTLEALEPVYGAHDVVLVVAGLSAQRGPEAYVITNSPTSECPFEVIPVTRSQLLLPDVPGTNVQDIETESALRRCVVDVLTQQRAARHPVGGFIELTTINRDWTAQRVIHRWPDSVGAATCRVH